jgi:nicotinamide-nucleotide amidase
VLPAREGLARAEIACIGRELLRGRVADRNAAPIARALNDRGLVVSRIAIVDDTLTAIATLTREVLAREPHLLVTSGGLGPAEDDRTLAGVGQVLGLPLLLDHAAQELVEEAYRRQSERRLATPAGLTRGREKLCRLPKGFVPVANPVGIVPGAFHRLDGGAVVLCLPGVPDEAQAVLEAALPQLKFAVRPGETARRDVEAPTIDEAALLPLIDQLSAEFPEVWIRSEPSGARRPGGRVLIHLEALGPDREQADAAVDGAIKRLLALAAGGP